LIQSAAYPLKVVAASAPLTAAPDRSSRVGGAGARADLDGVEKRVVRRHALPGPLRQAITPGGAFLIGEVDRFGWPALNRLNVDILPCMGPASKEARMNNVLRDYT
jgi:hypothetical protein